MIITVIVRKAGFFYGSTIAVNPMDNTLNRETMIDIINPYDESALNLALTMKKADPETRILVVTPRADDAGSLLDHALALGADEGIIMEAGPTDPNTPAQLALHWAGVLETLDWDLLLMGIRTIDMHEDELGVYLGIYLGLPIVSGIKSLSTDQDSNQLIRAERKLEKGHSERINCPLPALATVELISETRYPFLRDIARQKEQRVAAVLPRDKGRLHPGQAAQLEKLLPPKVRPKKGLVEVDNSLSVADKLGQLFSGGVTEKKGATDTLNGPAATVARKLVDHLEEKGFLQ